MADQSIMQRIAQALTGGSGGMAQYADPGYSMYVREAKAIGQTPMSQEQWARVQQANQAPVQQQAAMPEQPAKPFRF